MGHATVMTEARKLTREEIWRRIRDAGGREAFVLAEMKRLGFWPDGSGQPTLAESFIAERTQLEARLRKLGSELARVEDPVEALKLLHKERKKAALERREQTRRKRNEERFQRASAWHQRQAGQITYLGEGPHFISLTRKTMDHARLATNSLPALADAAELAKAMGITINELRFLCFQRDVATVSHYQRFTIPKKSGGERLISAPMPRLKQAQHWLLQNILDKVPVTDLAHGFVKQRNILSNALPHVGKPVVVNLDLENFFPSISYPRVKGVYRQLGYSEEIATLCAVLSTEAPTDTYELDGQRYFVKSGEPVLPQGAPTSPALSNLLCRRLDKRLRGAAAKLGFEFTRYADDLTFSSAAADNLAIKKLLWRVRKIVAAEGLKVHPRKTRVMRRHQRQEVTGVVVNEKPSVCREELRKFRALLFQIDKDGPEGKKWREGSLFNSIEGFANFVAMVDPGKGAPLRKKVAELRAKYVRERAFAPAGRLPPANRWSAKARPAPVLELTAAQLLERKKQEEAARQPPPEPKQQSRQAAREAPRPSTPGGWQRPAAERPSGGTSMPWWGWLVILWAVGSLLRIMFR